MIKTEKHPWKQAKGQGSPGGLCVGCHHFTIVHGPMRDSPACGMPSRAFTFSSLATTTGKLGRLFSLKSKLENTRSKILINILLRQLQFLLKSCLPQNVCFYVCFLKDFWRWGILQGSSLFNILNSVVQNLAWCAWQPWWQKALYKCIINIII